MLTDEELISAVRRSDEAWCAQIATRETLDYGVAFCASEHPQLSAASQLRDVWLAETAPEKAYAEAEAYFAGRGLRCDRWVPASGQAIEPVESLLTARGWRRNEHVAAQLIADTATLPRGEATIRVLPARAMRRAYKATFDEEVTASAALDRLNDSNLDAFVAMHEGVAVGRAAFHEVGDIGRLADLHVLPAFRRRGVGRTLVAHFVQIVRRVSPRVVVAACESADTGARGFLERCGFRCGATMVTFERSAGA